jgi:hypothetical protein
MRRSIASVPGPSIVPATKRDRRATKPASPRRTTPSACRAGLRRVRPPAPGQRPSSPHAPPTAPAVQTGHPAALRRPASDMTRPPGDPVQAWRPRDADRLGCNDAVPHPADPRQGRRCRDGRRRHRPHGARARRYPSRPVHLRDRMALLKALDDGGGVALGARGRHQKNRTQRAWASCVRSVRSSAAVVAAPCGRAQYPLTSSRPLLTTLPWQDAVGAAVPSSADFTSAADADG